MEEENICHFTQCKLPLDPSSSEHCILHSHDEKDINLFQQKLSERIIDGEKNNFWGIVFPPGINLKDIPNISKTNFSCAVFKGSIDLSYCEFVDANFNQAVFEQETDFSSTHFSSTATFWYAEFRSLANFSNAIFEDCKAEFGSVTFHGGVNFHKCKFSGIGLFFDESKFYGRSVHFEEASFESTQTSFKRVEWHGNEVYFSGSVFKGESLYFNNSNFNNKSTAFIACKFLSSYTGITGCNFKQSYLNFTESSFLGDETNLSFSEIGSANFYRATARTAFKLDNIKLSKRLWFESFLLTQPSYFSMRNLQFDFTDEQSKDTTKSTSEINKVKPGKKSRIEIHFGNIIFPQFTTYFENVGYYWDGTMPGSFFDTPIIEFETCQIKDAYFISNTMKYFAFKNTMINECRFMSTKWYSVKDRMIFPYIRENILFDDINPVISKYGLLSTMELYTQLKASYDRNNSYRNAGWF